MSIRIVTNQAEWDALPDHFSVRTEIHIESRDQINIKKTPDNSVAVLYGSSSAVLWGSSSAVLRESSRAVLYGSSSAVLYGSSSAVLWGSSRAVLYGSSSAVLRESSRAVLRGSSNAVLRESSRAVLRGSSNAVLYGSSSAVLCESSRAVLRGSSNAVLCDQSRAVLWDQSTAHYRERGAHVKAFGNAVVFQYVKPASAEQVSGTNIIKVKPPKTAGAWLKAHGITPKDGNCVLYKRVSELFKTQEGTARETDWTPGTSVEHPEWNPHKSECGGGKLHACPAPYFCDEFRDGTHDRYVAIQIAVKDLYCWPENPSYPHKIAFRRGTVLYEVDRWGCVHE